MRKLTKYQMKPWMDKIAKKRKYKNQAKGEASGMSKLTEKEVGLIYRSAPDKQWREIFCQMYGISERHWYLIRSGMRWKHLLK